jgi:hypothetical protein
MASYQTQIYNCSLSWRDKETSHASSYYEMIAGFPTVSNTLTRNSVIIIGEPWVVFEHIFVIFITVLMVRLFLPLLVSVKEIKTLAYHNYIEIISEVS